MGGERRRRSVRQCIQRRSVVLHVPVVRTRLYPLGRNPFEHLDIRELDEPAPVEQRPALDRQAQSLKLGPAYQAVARRKPEVMTAFAPRRTVRTIRRELDELDPRVRVERDGLSQVDRVRLALPEVGPSWHVVPEDRTERTSRRDRPTLARPLEVGDQQADVGDAMIG